MAYMSFFILRSFSKHKLYPEEFSEVMSTAPDTETVEALIKLE